MPTPARSAPSGKNIMRALVLSTGAAVLLYAATIALSGWHGVARALARIDAAGWSAVFALSAANFGLRFVRWQIYLRRLGHELPRRYSAGVYLAGFAFTTTPAKAGEAVRSIYLKGQGVGYGDSLACLFAETARGGVAQTPTTPGPRFLVRVGRSESVLSPNRRPATGRGPARTLPSPCAQPQKLLCPRR